jgi:hypothetical protein
METLPEMPVEATIPAPLPDREKEIAMAAAINIDRWRGEKEELKRLLESANIAIQIAENRLATLSDTLTDERKRHDDQLAQERSRHESLQARYDAINEECAAYREFLASAKTDFGHITAKMDRFELPVFRRRNGKRNGKPVLDVQGGEASLAGSAPVLAHVESVLGQSGES